MPTLERQTLYSQKEIASYLSVCTRPDGGKKRSERCSFWGFAFGLLLLRPIHPEHVSGDFAGIGPGWASCPPVQGLVAVQHDPDVLRLVFVPGGVGISEAQLATKRFDVIGFPGQEQPARLDPVAFGVIAQHFGCVLFRLEGEGIHENIAPNAIPKSLLHLHQVRRLTRATTLACCVHEIDQQDLALDQIIVEPHSLALVSPQNDVGEVARSRPGARCGCLRDCSLPGKKRSNWSDDETCKQHSSVHGSVLPFSMRLENCPGMTVEPCPHFTTSHRNIMAWSS